MNPALLAAINKGGGKAPSKMAGKDKVKMKKKPPVRADQRQIEKPNANAGRVVGKNYKPDPNKPRPVQTKPSNPANDALLGNILLSISISM